MTTNQLHCGGTLDVLRGLIEDESVGPPTAPSTMMGQGPAVE